jgi:hypothetical protein
MDVMQYLWTGSWPANKAPHVYSLQINRKKATDNVYLKQGNNYEVLAVATDPENNKLTYRWELLPEPIKVSEGGDFEERPKAVNNIFFNDSGNGKVTLKVPAGEGAYRLFVYISDGNNNVATANIPFYVK